MKTKDEDFPVVRLFLFTDMHFIGDKCVLIWKNVLFESSRGCHHVWYLFVIQQKDCFIVVLFCYVVSIKTNCTVRGS